MARLITPALDALHGVYEVASVGVWRNVASESGERTCSPSAQLQSECRQLVTGASDAIKVQLEKQGKERLEERRTGSR